MMKKNCRRLISGILALVLLVSLPLNASAFPAFVMDVPDPVHGDADEIPWYCEAVYYLWYAHVVDAAEGDFYRPDRSITREQFLTFLARLAEVLSEKEVIKGLSALDAAPDDCVKWALENHILCGKPEDLGRSDFLTREEMAVFMVRFAAYMEVEIEPAGEPSDYAKFLDYDRVARWADESMKKAYSFRLIVGEKDRDGNHLLNPQRMVTRAEAAQVLYNYAEAAHLPIPQYNADVGAYAPPANIRRGHFWEK